jgi:DNA-binding FrmR family transcriptional regulator
MDGDMKAKILNRLKSIEGHMRGVHRMIEEDEYCIDILKQTLAVQRAIDKVNALILERHLQTCVTTAIRGDDPDEREQVIHELLDVFEATSKL